MRKRNRRCEQKQEIEKRNEKKKVTQLENV